MSQKFTADTVQPGRYTYMRSDWKSPIPATVKQEGDDLVVEFRKGFNPTPIEKIPVDAIFTPVDENGKPKT